MTTELSSIFGTEIKVTIGPRQASRSYYGFAGVHGVTAMFMGSRGFGLTVTGTIRAATRALADSAVAAIEALQWLGINNYSHHGSYYYRVVWEDLEVLKDSAGKSVFLVAPGQFTCKFRIHGKGLI